jgi:hypothetical protein
MKIIGIDPGNEYSAFVYWDSIKGEMIDKAKLPNHQFFFRVRSHIWGVSSLDDVDVAIEVPSSYGMPVGQTTFDTCIFIGILKLMLEQKFIKPKFIFRGSVKMHHCHSITKVTDGAISAALRMKYGEDNTQKKPNKIYWNETMEKNKADKYMNNDLWAAFAVATCFSENREFLISNPMEREEIKLSTFMFKDFNNHEEEQ